MTQSAGLPKAVPYIVNPDSKRISSYPQIPTTAEQGFPTVQIGHWAGLYAPAGTPQPIIDKLNAEVQKALADPDNQKRFAQIGLEPAGTTPQGLTDYLDAEQKKWGEVAKRDNIRIKD